MFEISTRLTPRGLFVNILSVLVAKSYHIHNLAAVIIPLHSFIIDSKFLYPVSKVPQNEISYEDFVVEKLDWLNPYIW